MGDYIERKAASDAACAALTLIPPAARDALKAAIGKVSPADVRPVVRGRWLHETEIEGHACGECSACHKIRVIDNFCPNCGADMREETNCE